MTRQASTNRSGKPPRISIIGAGDHSRLHHGPSLLECSRRLAGQIELAAVCDLDEDRAKAYAKDFGFASFYCDLPQMLADSRSDALVVITPVEATFRLVSQLLPLRLPLLIEKPPGQTSAETRQLLELASQANCPHMISFNRRFDPAVTRARQWLAEHGQGRPIKLLIARMLREARRETNFIVGTGIHAIDALLSFMPQPTEVVSHIWHAGTTESCDSRIAFADGAAAVLAVAPDCGVFEETYELIGSEYSLRIDTATPALTIFDRGQIALQWRAPADMPAHHKSGTLAETEVFLQAVISGQGYAPTLAAGLTSMVVAEAVAAGGKHELI